MNIKTLAIIVAGGSGWRLSGLQSPDENGRGVPKQYMLLSTQCILDHTISCFTKHREIDHVMVVIHREDQAVYDRMISNHEKLLPVVLGGDSRQQSVYCGLEAANKTGFDAKVLIHDGVRPFIDAQTISQVLAKISPQNGTLPAHRVADTLKKSTNELKVIETIARDNVFCAQTPQGFLMGDIFQVHKDAAEDKNTGEGVSRFTDDASMFEAVGLSVSIVDAPASNFKITTADDLDRARHMVAKQQKEVTKLHADIRTGNGYDVHALIPGDEIILCGHKIAFNKSLKGHSDADAALHALTDALLGTIGSGDIGSHFPPSDPQWKDAASDYFLTTALELVRAEGGVINNIDITIICEAPKIGPHRQAMREKLAQLCDLALGRVSVKATTNEELGFLGRSEGIAAIATTTISFGIESTLT
ncbi:MAG: bifunctional 2-C-methyl-D-erythritol 4-phosphate cytidylyltransferase/2-C-methyl-D-erythritol 2,4-cyclodiphosphate synthase [Hyphomicrobiales bacterium]|nr:bifunctional 2-C-methyl-D-erythritol 4-phosphate cytidylyltransferase/2-C-methyl-D-erythritol 2,4-cyclodiphosphate synthase [Hyphomicrobiales bacterium]